MPAYARAGNREQGSLLPGVSWLAGIFPRLLHSCALSRAHLHGLMFSSLSDSPELKQPPAWGLPGPRASAWSFQSVLALDIVLCLTCWNYSA